MDAGELAARIVDYRTRAGLTQQALADSAGMDRTALAKVESGQRRVTALELDSLARALDLRTDWFFQPPPASVVAYRSALDPDAPTAAIDLLLERLTRDVDFVQEQSNNLSEFAGESRDIASKVEAEMFARQVRNRMGLQPCEPITGIADVAARLGALIFSVELGASAPEGASALALHTGIAIVNGSLKVGRRRLAAAHELGHLLTRDGYRVDWRLDAPDQDAWETRLDQFARALLLPELAVRETWSAGARDAQRAIALRLGSEFQVDMATLARRLVDLCLIGDAEANWIRATRTTKADIVDLNLVVRDDLAAPSAPLVYQRAVLNAYRSDTITAGRAVDLLLGTFSEAELPAPPQLPESATWSLL